MDAGGELTQAADKTTHDSSRVSARVHAPDRWLAVRVQRMIEPAAVRLELWDGSSPYASAREPIGDLLVGDRRTLFGLALNPELWFGESYMAGRLEVRGPLEPVVEALTANSPLQPSWFRRLRLTLAHSNSLKEARHNVHQHYDLGNPFYQL